MAIEETTEELLRSEPLAAFLATANRDRPHVAPVWYRYSEGTIEVTTTGKKLDNVRANPRVALSVHKDDGGIPKWTVTVLGTATAIDDATEIETVVEKINRRYGVENEAWADNTLVRIDVGSAAYRRY